MNNSNSLIKTFWQKEKYLLFALVGGLLLAYSEYTSLIMVIAFIIVLLKNRSIPSYGDFESICLNVTFLSFFIIYSFINSNAIYWGLYYSATPVLMYMIGKYLASKWYNEDCLFLVMLLVAIGIGLPHLVVTIRDIFVNGLVNPQRSLGILDDEENINVTLRTIALSLFCFGFMLFPYKSLSFSQKTNKLIFLFLAVLALLCFLHYLSRTGLVFVVLMVILGVLMTRRKGGNIFLVAVLFFLMLYLISVSSSLTEIFGLFSERQSLDSSVFEAGGRSERWLLAWKGLFAHPLGGVKDTMFAHNLWLDVGRMAGVFPFLGLVLFSVSNTIKSIRIAYRSNNPQLIKMMVVGFMLLFILSNFTECTIVGLTSYVFLYIMFCGMVNAIYQKSLKHTINR